MVYVRLVLYMLTHLLITIIHTNIVPVALLSFSYIIPRTVGTPLGIWWTWPVGSSLIAQWVREALKISSRGVSPSSLPFSLSTTLWTRAMHFRCLRTSPLAISPT